MLEVGSIEELYPLDLLRHRPVPLVVHLIPERGRPDGQPLAGPPRHLLARPLGDLLPLELVEGNHDRGHDPPRGGGRVDLFLEGDELDVVPLELLDESQEVDDVPRDAVDLREDDDVDEAGPDLRHEVGETRPLQVLS